MMLQIKDEVKENENLISKDWRLRLIEDKEKFN